MGYLRMAPFSASGASSLCLRRTFGFSQSQLSFGQFGDRHAVQLSHRQRQLLNVSVRPQLVCPAYVRPVPERADKLPTITIGMNELAKAVRDMKCTPESDYKTELMNALVKLKMLAADGRNRGAMKRLHSLLPNVMAPLSSVDLHRNEHSAWSKLAAVSLELMWILVQDPSPPQRDTVMKYQMSKYKEELTGSMEGILRCNECDKQLHMLADKILAQVKKHTPTSAPS